MILGDMGAEIIKVEKPGMTMYITRLLITNISRHLQHVHHYCCGEKFYPTVSWRPQVYQHFCFPLAEFVVMQFLSDFMYKCPSGAILFSVYVVYFILRAKCACMTITQPFSETTWVSRYQKGKTNLDFTEARDSEWQWHLLGHMQVCTSLQTDNHASNPPLSFYRPHALPATQPTASKQ